MVVLSSFCYPESPVVLQNDNVQVLLDRQDYGLGILYVSERIVCWKGQGDVGFSVPYEHITLHAICKDPQVCPNDCVYIMLDAHVDMPGRTDSNAINTPSEDSSDEDCEVNVSEVLFIPTNSSDVTSIYQSMADCQGLNPDPEDMSDEDEEDAIYEDAEDQEIDFGGAGDAEIETITNRLSGNSIQVNYEQRNGNENDDLFEDAD